MSFPIRLLPAPCSRHFQEELFKCSIKIRKIIVNIEMKKVDNCKLITDKFSIIFCNKFIYASLI